MACFNTYIIRFKPRCKPAPNSSGASPGTMSHFLGSLYGDRGYKAFERREGLGFEGLRSPTGGEIDPPMWGTVLILVQYPTTLDFNFSGNFPPIKSFMAANIEPPQRGGGS